MRRAAATRRRRRDTPAAGRWWPDWKDPLVWLLGLTFGANNSMYFGANAFVPDYLVSQGRADLIGAALGRAQRRAARRHAAADPGRRRGCSTGARCLISLFGPMSFLSAIGLVLSSGVWIVVFAASIGFSTAMTFAVMLALPPMLSKPGDVHRTAAGMFTISYSCAVIIPTLSGALWDLTGIPWTVFVALGVCALAQTVLGVALSRYRTAAA